MSEPNRITGRFLTYPDTEGRRLAEGGRRLSGGPQRNRSSRPLVTIITVCWNSEKTIEQAIQSVLGQTYDNIEYVIVDGASSDTTLDIIQKYAANIEYYVSEPDQGLYFAMNKGLELAQGEYILFLNSDDWYTPDAVEALVNAKDYSGCDFVSALANYVDEETGEQKTLRSMPFDHSQYLRMSIRHETMLVPATIYDQLGGYDTKYRILSDREYATRLFENACTHYEIRRSLLNFRTSGVSNTNIKLLREEQDLILASDFPFLTGDDRKKLNDHASATPETFIDMANANLDQPKFAFACRAFLVDHKASHGAKWQSGDVRTIGATVPGEYPAVSVILPFYSAEKTIGASLDSVLGQTLKDIEVICVNDCAVDESQTIIDEYVRRDPRIRSVKNFRNMGLGASRNAGVRAARGRYIFHIDPDDTIPSNALKLLYDIAGAHGSAMVKGAFRAEQLIHGRPIGAGTIKYPCGIEGRETFEVSPTERSMLLQSTEGHWSILYAADFAQTVPYPTDLKMGQDSIFLVNALARAPSISLTPEIVYNYQVNPVSAMNNFSAQKCFDEIEWRRRAWFVLEEAAQSDMADHILYSYWDPAFFDALSSILSAAQRREFFQVLGGIFENTEYRGFSAIKNPKISNVFRENLMSGSPRRVGLAENNAGWSGTFDKNALRIAAFSTRDHGGAGLASKRCVDALRDIGQRAELYCYITKGAAPYIKRTPPDAKLNINPGDDAALGDAWRDRAVLTHTNYPQLKARELFSKTGAVVDFNDLKPIFDGADVVHFHWAVGMFDFRNAANVIGNKPAVWTLHDMNPFTGGCHYSEGCDGFKRACEACPLLNGSDIAHGFWNQKKLAYGGLRNLHIVCPSQWLADLAAESSLFRGFPIHVIPNPLPVDVFRPVNKLTARRRLGFPLDKKLVLFGADSLANKRKGGDLLVESIEKLSARGLADGVEGVVFGASSLQIGVKTHSLGEVSDASKLALVYAAADAFAFPSREDNAPMTLAEAMLCGTPAVSFPVGNAEDLITHRETGYIARYQDTTDFAEGLAWALEAPRSEVALARSINCHLTAKAHNDPDDAARKLTELYQSIIEAAKSDLEAPKIESQDSPISKTGASGAGSYPSRAHTDL